MKVLSLKKDDSVQAPPVHVAIIMDGNGRWAHARGQPRIAGHRKGADAVRTTINCAVEQGVGYLTLFGFSSENWQRPAAEVKDLMGLLRFYLKSETRALHKEGVRIRVIGDRDRLDSDIISLIDEAEALTAGNQGLNLTVALSYGGRREITTVVRQLARSVAAGEISPDDIDEDAIGRRLYTAEIPDPDLLIRTSGEQRISNFLLWQLAYTELVFLDVLWPDFSKRDFEAAIAEFHRRERRYGTSGG